MAKPKAEFQPQTPKPDAEYVQGLYEARKSEGDEQRLRGQIQQLRPLTKMEHDVPIPKEYKAITSAIRTPYIRDAWHRISAAMVQRSPVSHIEPRDETQDARAAANIGERWDSAVVEQLSRDTNEDVIYEDTRSLVRDGEGVLKVVHRPDAWANFPQRNRGEAAAEYSRRADDFKRGVPLPFAWRSVDRLQMLFGDGEYGDDWALEYGEYPNPYLKRRYQLAERDGRLYNPSAQLGGKPKPEGELTTTQGHSIKIEYFEPEWWHVVVDGEDAPGFPKPNPYYPFLPYFRSKAPDSESLLYSLMFLVPGLDKLLTMKMNWAYLGAYANPVVETQPNVLGPGSEAPFGEDNQPSTVIWRPGKAMELPIGKTIKFLVPPPVGQDIDELIVIFRGLIDIAGIPGVFRGVGGSDQSGYSINQLMAAAYIAFKMSAQSQQRKFEKALEFMHHLVRYRIRQTVYALGALSKDDGKKWLGLKPEGSVTTTEAPVGLLGPVTFTFRPTLPTDEQSRAMIANQLVNSPKALLSRRRAIEKYLLEEDPEDILEEIAVEDAMGQEPIRSLLLEKALRERGLLPQQPNPAAALVAPDGSPLLPPSPYVPGQAAGGLPAVPGLNQPLQPPAPEPPALSTGGRPAGSYPGRPGGVSRRVPGP